MTVHKKILLASSIIGALSVILGAFGAHALQNIIDAKALKTYQIGISYQFYHAIALLGVAAWIKNDIEPSVWIGRAAFCFIIGVLLFSGSLYLIALKEILGLQGWVMKIIGPSTPIGGTFFIIGWLLLATSIFIKNK